MINVLNRAKSLNYEYLHGLAKEAIRSNNMLDERIFFLLKALYDISDGCDTSKTIAEKALSDFVNYKNIKKTEGETK